MKKFIGISVQEALINASRDLACLVDELDYEIVLSPKKGFLGLWKQDAVILAQKRQKETQKQTQAEIQTQIKDEPKQEELSLSHEIETGYGQVEENFFQEKTLDRAKKLSNEIYDLLTLLPYEIDQVKVRIEKDSYANVEITGRDCGLLIGERGYRYSAIYYLLSIWIKKDYGLGLRLEIADFLKNKEKRVEAYLEEHYDTIMSRTFFQSQSFDPLTANIALRRFREAIPNKYIIARQISELESVIVINEFRTK